MKTKKRKNTNRTLQKKIFRTLVGGIFFSFVLYAMAITYATVNIASAKTHNQDIVAVQTDIAELELEYFEMVNDLTIEQAKSLGLQEGEQVHFVRLDEVKAVAYNL